MRNMVKSFLVHLRPVGIGVGVKTTSIAASLATSNVLRRSLHLAPPFLLDSYIPRYQLLSSVDAAKKRGAAYAHLRKCNLCPRLCNVNRYETTGHCLIGAETVKVSTIAPHFGEEPCLQGHNGSGSVFFSGCNLRCVFCQNHDIAHQKAGFDLTPEELAEWMVKLQEVGNVHNINFVTPVSGRILLGSHPGG
jgi:putative pyruvate formate lyase activating enzyme